MTMRPRILLAALLGATLAQSGAAHAATISFADAMTVLARDCGADVEKYCKGLNIGNNKIADCLAANRAKVSPVCHNDDGRREGLAPTEAGGPGERHQNLPR